MLDFFDLIWGAIEINEESKDPQKRKQLIVALKILGLVTLLAISFIIIALVMR